MIRRYGPSPGGSRPETVSPPAHARSAGGAGSRFSGTARGRAAGSPARKPGRAWSDASPRSAGRSARRRSTDGTLSTGDRRPLGAGRVDRSSAVRPRSAGRATPELSVLRNPSPGGEPRRARTTGLQVARSSASISDSLLGRTSNHFRGNSQVTETFADGDVCPVKTRPMRWPRSSQTRSSSSPIGESSFRGIWASS
jgi:hypothetical protein